MGELGLLGLSMPEEYGGQGGDYFANIVLAEEIARGGCGGFLMGLSVHTDMVMPPLLEFGSEEQKQSLAGRPGSRASRSSASGSPSPTRVRTSPQSAPERSMTTRPAST